MMKRLVFWLKQLQREAAWLVPLLLVYLLVQTFFLQPPSLSDELSYFRTAMHPFTPGTAFHVHQELRIGLIVPVMLGIKLWGVSEAAYYFLPYLAGVLLVTATYLLGRLLFNRNVGVGAALLMSVNPYILQESGQLMPDTMGTACYTMGLALLVLACKVRQKFESSQTPHAIVPWLLASGFFFGWSYLAREFILILSPLILVIFGLYKLPIRYLGYLLLPFLACLGLECCWGWVVCDNPFVRVSTAAVPRHVSEATQDVLHGFDVVKAFPVNLWTQPLGFIFVGWLGFFLAGVAWVREKRSYMLLLFWFLIVWGFFTALGLFPYGEGKTLLRVQKMRYWFPVLPAMWIGITAAGEALYQRLKSSTPLRVLRVVTGILIVACCFLSVKSTSLVPHKFVLQGENHYWRLREWLASSEGHDKKLLWTDMDFVSYLQVYSRTFWGQPLWHGDIKVFNFKEKQRPKGYLKKFLPVQNIQKGAVILHKASLQVALLPPKGKSSVSILPYIPNYLWHVPENWRLLMATPSLDWYYHKHRNGGEMMIFDLASQKPDSGKVLTIQNWTAFDYKEPSEKLKQKAVSLMNEGKSYRLTVPNGKKYYFKVDLNTPEVLKPGQYLHGFVPRLDTTGKAGRLVFACRFQSPGKAVEDGFGVSTYTAPFAGFPAEWVCLPSKDHPDWPVTEVGFRVKGPMTVVFDRPVVKIGQFPQG